MSTHEQNQDRNGTDLQPETHEQLCALVLGELEGEQRVQLERELERSPELRAERERIESTIGLVRAACGGPQSLSDNAVARLEGLATAKRRPWYATGTFRVAAGFGLVALSLVVMNEGRNRRQENGPAEDALARVDRRVELAKESRELGREGVFVEEARKQATHEAGTDLAELIEEIGTMNGYPAAAGRPLELEESQLRLRQVRKQELAGEQVTKFGLQPESAELIDQLSALGYTGVDADELLDGSVAELGVPSDSAPATETSTRNSLPAVEAEQLDDVTVGLRFEYLGQDVAGNKAAEPDASRDAGISVINMDGYGAGTGNPAYDPSLDPASGADTFFLGATVNTVEPVDAPALQLEFGRRARGAGSATPSSPGPAGPSTPGQVALDESLLRGLVTGGGGVGGQPAGGQAASPGHADLTSGAAPRLESKSEAYNFAGFEAGGYGEAEKSVLGSELEEADRSVDGFLDYGEGDKRGRDERHFKRTLDPEAEIRLRVDRVLQDCRRHSQERPSMMYFRFWGDNGFELAQLDAQSTFGVDVDTASYTLARRYLRDGYLPEKAQIRTEEFVNYFEPDVPAPTEGTFAIHTDLAPSRFGSESAGGIRVSNVGDRWMLRVVVRGKEVSREERQPLQLTFVVDTSGSMKEENRLELVKHSLRLLMTELDARDSISIVAFSNEARMTLPMTSAAQRGVIEAAIYGLNPDGGTNAEAGLLLGYAQAAQHLSNAAQSRVVLLSDGVANIGQTDQDRINTEVKRQREAGIFLNTVGVGMGNHNDVFLEQLANKGDGLCNYVDSEIEARRALVENFTGAFTPIARDVKVQVEFDPAQVYRYRQLGYENRAIADVDFRNDAIDAGEVGAGHQVVALYEIELLKPADEAPLATVRLRWKKPTGVGRDPLEDSATEVEAPVHFKAGTAWEGSSDGYKRSVLVAQFAELLRRSTHARNDSLDELIAETAALAPRLNDADFTEFLAMVEKSRELVLRARPAYEPISHCVDRLRRNRCLSAEYEALKLDKGHALLDDLERQNRELEARIRDLIREQVSTELR